MCCSWRSLAWVSASGWSQHEPLSLFGLFAIPAPYAFSRSQSVLIGGLHYWAATAIVVLAGGHAFAALFHHFVRRDGVLRRMLPERGRRPLRPQQTPARSWATGQGASLHFSPADQPARCAGVSELTGRN
jgi:Prokaryotic cytochrome b561